VVEGDFGAARSRTRLAEQRVAESFMALILEPPEDDAGCNSDGYLFRP